MCVDGFVRSFLLTTVVVALATPAGGQSRQVIGYAGVLGEWELIATVTDQGDHRPTRDDTCWHLHTGGPGAKDGGNPYTSLQCILEREGDIAD